MTTMQFRPAQRTKTKLRMAIDGPAGSGKTFTALRFAFALGKRVAVICSEAGSAEKYKGESPDGFPWEFDILVLEDFSPTTYVQAIAAAIGRYDVLVVDSLSHAWAGKGGALELVDQKTKAANSKNAFTTGWRDVTPMHNQLVDALLRCPMHLICTMRSKMGYVVENNIPKKVGLEPVQRNGMEYEFDVLADMNIDHGIFVSKSRCSVMQDKYTDRPGPAFIGPLVHWLNEGADVPQEIIDAAGFMERIRQPDVGSGAVDKPRKSAEQLAQEAAEKAAKKQTKSVEPEPEKGARDANAVNVANGEKPCTSQHSEQIKSLFATLGMTPEQQTKALAKRNAQAVRNLTVAQAEELIAILADKVKAAAQATYEATAAVAAAAKDEAATATTLADQPVTSAEESGPCTAEQVATIKALITEINDDAMAGRIVDKLKSAGLKLAQLTWKDATQLEACLRVRVLDDFFAADLARFEAKAEPQPATPGDEVQSTRPVVDDIPF